LKVFVFQGVEKLTDSYHSNGGLVVIANDETEVNQLIASDEHIRLDDSNWKHVTTYELAGNEIQPTYYVFPDAGCC